jgi:death-on-curing protein
MTEYLELRDALRMVRRLEIGPVRDLGLLDSALARPRTTLFGVDAYESLKLKAAALLHSLVSNHALVDGNKRLAWLATVVFLDLNDHETSLGDDAAFALVWDAASGQLDLAQIATSLAIREIDGRQRS